MNRLNLVAPLINLAVFCFWLGLVGIGLECVLRISSKFYGHESNNFAMCRADDYLGWSNQPNSKLTFVRKMSGVHSLCEINSKGLRDTDRSWIKPKDTLRILLLGDSFVFGAEVSSRDVVSAVLERKISKIRKSEVINAGVRGYGTDQELLYLTKEGVKYSPDIVIYFFCHNDPVDNLTIYSPSVGFAKPFFDVTAEGELILMGVPVPPPSALSGSAALINVDASQRSEIENLRKSSNPAAKVYAANPIELLIRNSKLFKFCQFILQRVPSLYGPKRQKSAVMKDIEEKEWAVTKKIISQMKIECEKRSIRFLIYEISNGTEKGRDAHMEPVFRASGTPFILTREIFGQKSGGTKWLCFPYDGHWNKKGHRLAAEIINNFLLTHGWI